MTLALFTIMPRYPWLPFDFTQNLRTILTSQPLLLDTPNPEILHRLRCSLHFPPSPCAHLIYLDRYWEPLPDHQAQLLVSICQRNPPSVAPDIFRHNTTPKTAIGFLLSYVLTYWPMAASLHASLISLRSYRRRRGPDSRDRNGRINFGARRMREKILWRWEAVGSATGNFLGMRRKIASSMSWMRFVARECRCVGEL